MACERTPGSGPFLQGDVTLHNWANTFPPVAPRRAFTPDTVDELVAIVREAEASGLKVRAMGSGWSFSDLMITPDYAIVTDALKRILSATAVMLPTSQIQQASQTDPVFKSYTRAATQRYLVHVEAGIKLNDLYTRLEQEFAGPTLQDNKAHGFALTTLGGSGGQSLCGVIATGSHGGDVRLPPIADMVQAIHLVAPGGAEFFLQRGGRNAIVEADTLAHLMPCVAGRIIADDDVFNAALVGMGRMGIVYSLVIEVRQQYFLSEARAAFKWSAIQGAQIEPGGVIPQTAFSRY